MLLPNRVSRAVFGVVDLGKEEKTKSGAYRGNHGENAKEPFVGFRCVIDVDTKLLPAGKRWNAN